MGLVWVQEAVGEHPCWWLAIMEGGDGCQCLEFAEGVQPTQWCHNDVYRIYFFVQVPKVTHTEFCQGRTMRWALAWSFYENVKVPVSVAVFFHLHYLS